VTRNNYCHYISRKNGAVTLSAMSLDRMAGSDQVDYWEGALQLLYNKLSLKMIDHGSRSIWGPGPSRSRLQAQKHDDCDLAI